MAAQALQDAPAGGRKNLLSRRDAGKIMNDASGGVRIEPLVEADIGPLVALAGEIWRAHYPGIVDPAQIEYMLAQRYEPRLIRAELGRGDVWWDKLMVGDEMAGFVTAASLVLPHRPSKSQ